MFSVDIVPLEDIKDIDSPYHCESKYYNSVEVHLTLVPEERLVHSHIQINSCSPEERKGDVAALEVIFLQGVVLEQEGREKVHKGGDDEQDKTEAINHNKHGRDDNVDLE